MRQFILLIFVLNFSKLSIGQNTTLNPTSTDSIFTDPRDGQQYPYKTIGTQVWMTKNLNYTDQRSYCYNNNDSNCVIYGCLYNWFTALTVAPPGWHLPSDEEWRTLINFLGGKDVAGGKMKSTNRWLAPNTGANNGSSFEGLPSGIRNYKGTFSNFGEVCYWWSSTKYEATDAWSDCLYYTNTFASSSLCDRAWLFSVRCIRD